MITQGVTSMELSLFRASELIPVTIIYFLVGGGPLMLFIHTDDGVR